MRCVRCGEEYLEDSRFCTNCGQILNTGVANEENGQNEKNNQFLGSVQYGEKSHDLGNQPKPSSEEYLMQTQHSGNNQYMWGNQSQNRYSQYGEGGSVTSVLKVVGIVMSLCGCVILAISTFIPYVKIEFLGYKETVSMFEMGEGEDAYICLAIAIITLILTLTKSRHVIKAGAIATALLIYKVIVTADSIDETAGEWATLIHNDIGAYLSIISSVIILVAGVVIMIVDKKENQH